MTRRPRPDPRRPIDISRYRSGLVLGVVIALLWSQPASACPTPRLVDSQTGAAIAGPEDLAVLPDGRGIIVSAYDRWSVADIVTTEAESVPRGGLYYVPADALSNAGDRLAAEPLLNPAFLDLRPHGIALWSDGDLPRLGVINRRYNRATGGWQRDTALEVFAIHLRGDGVELAHRDTVESPMLCRANDVAPIDGERWLVTRDRGSCKGPGRVVEDMLSLRRGHLLLAGPGGVRSVTGPAIGFANGIAVRPAPERGYLDIYVAATRERQIRRYRLNAAAGTVQERIPLLVPAAPDNLSWGDDRTLLIAAHPDLLTLAAYRARLPWFDDAPSAVYRVDVEKDLHAAAIYRNPGAETAGATSAVRLNKLLIIGNAFESRLTICRADGE